VVPAQGKVDVLGEVPAGAFLVFHPVGPTPVAKTPGSQEPLKPSAQVKEDGSFALSTYESGDGAPAGDYAVTVEWYRLIREGNDAKAGPNVVPARYARPETTPLKVTITEGAAQLPPLSVAK
jgi:hypothetical protein